MGSDIKSWHYEDKCFIQESLKRNSRRFIVLSHYNPSSMLSDSYVNMRMQSSNDEDLLVQPIQIWLSGASCKNITGCIGPFRDVFIGINSYSSYITKYKLNNKYSNDLYASLRTEPVYLV